MYLRRIALIYTNDWCRQATGMKRLVLCIFSSLCWQAFFRICGQMEAGLRRC